jgi:uncharacterized membrane protein YfcA
MPGFDPSIAAAGLCVGILVGLTGMGGGALMTPVLVFCPAERSAGHHLQVAQRRHGASGVSDP